MKKFAIVTRRFGLFGWETFFNFADSKEEAESLEKSFREGFDKNKVQFVETIRYSEYLIKYKKDYAMGKSITIHVYDDNSGDYLHCFDGSSETVCNGEVLEFNHTIKKLGIEIENAEFNVDWCSEEHNGMQIALVTLVPNSGKVIFPNGLKKDMDNALKTFIEVERRLEILGKKDELKKLADAHNIISKYLKMQ